MTTTAAACASHFIAGRRWNGTTFDGLRSAGSICGQEALLHARGHFDLGQLAHDAPGLLVRGPLVAAERAALDVLVRLLAPAGSSDSVSSSGMLSLMHMHSDIGHLRAPRRSSAFFSVSMARKTRVFTAPSEQPAICAISAYDRP